eukprot:2268899-Rhodomonas_salina.1
MGGEGLVLSGGGRHQDDCSTPTRWRFQMPAVMVLITMIVIGHSRLRGTSMMACRGSWRRSRRWSPSTSSACEQRLARTRPGSRCTFNSRTREQHPPAPLQPSAGTLTDSRRLVIGLFGRRTGSARVEGVHSSASGS